MAQAGTLTIHRHQEEALFIPLLITGSRLSPDKRTLHSSMSDEEEQEMDANIVDGDLLEAAGGQRIITSGGTRHVNLIYPVILTFDIGGYNWQEWSMFTHSTFEEYPHS